MQARTGWDDDSVIADMRMNIINFTGHEHQDGGSFELYYKVPLTLHTVFIRVSTAASAVRTTATITSAPSRTIVC